MIGLLEKVGEDWKKKEKKGRSGLLDETQKLEMLGLSLVEFADGFSFPVEAEKAEEVAAMVAEMAEICGRMDEGLGALQMQVRELFNRIVRSRAETLDVLDQVNKTTTPVSLVDGVFDGEFRGVGDEEVVVGEGVMRFSPSFVRSTKSCFGGMMVSLIFLKPWEKDD
nr:BYPASS-related protein [Tanacetum cinerariifolium]